MVGDPIADFIVRLKNAALVGNERVSIPYSKAKFAIAELLEKEGYIASVAKKGKKVQKTIEVLLSYDESGKVRLTDVKRISKPSRRMYTSAGDVMSVKNGFGSVVLSTPQGIMTGVTAQKNNVGGEVLFEIW